MIDKRDGLPLQMDPYSYLNRAHQLERQAERMLHLCRYDEAIVCYNQAADHLEKSLLQTQHSSALLSLRLQLDNVRKQPKLVRKRQQWAKQRQDAALATTTQIGQLSRNPSAESDIMSRDQEDGAAGSRRLIMSDSAESRFNSTEEVDSLLAMVRQHSVIEDKQPRYRLSQLLTAIKQLGLGSRQPVGDSPDVEEHHSEKNTTPRRPLAVSQQAKLISQNEELQTHLKSLFLELDGYERENRTLKKLVRDLEQQLECYRSRSRDHGRFEPAFMESSRLDTPFSLMGSFAFTPPTETLQLLEPLDFNRFEDNL